MASGRWRTVAPLVLATVLLLGASPVASGSSSDRSRQPTPALSRWLPMFGAVASRCANQPQPLVQSCNRDDCWRPPGETWGGSLARRFRFPRPPVQAIGTDGGVASAVRAHAQCYTRLHNISIDNLLMSRNSRHNSAIFICYTVYDHNNVYVCF